MPVIRTPWPRRLWAPARIRFATSLSPDEIVARLAEQAQGYAAPRGRNLSKVGFRIEVTSRGFKLFKVAGRFLGNPPRTIAVFDATTSQTGAGTLIQGQVRLPYTYLAMFCALWIATMASALVPEKGMFVAVLVLWGGFGSWFTLAQRADAGRSVSTFLTTLETGLGAPLTISLPDVEIPTAPAIPPQLAPAPLFSSRLQAGIFLGGLATFWGGFLVLGLMQVAAGGYSARHAPAGAGEIAVFVPILVGGLLLTVAQRGLLTRMTHNSIPTFGAMIRTMMPGTLIQAARKLDLNGPMVAGALYLVLLVGMVTFFSALTLH